MDRNKNPRMPTEKDFSGGAVQRAVFKETIQYPGTIIPFGISGGFAGLMLLGLMAVTPVMLIVPVASGLIGSGVWVYNYAVRGRSLAEEHVRKLRAQLEEARSQDLARLGNNFLDADFPEGDKELKELEASYLKIRNYLDEKAKAGQDLDATRFHSLAKDIYREGLNLLRSALEAHKALNSIDVDGLRKDRELYVRQLKKAKTASETKGLEAKIKNHEDRIAVHEKYSETLNEIMVQIENLEGVLENSYLELVDLVQGRKLTSQAESVARLERAVESARKVEMRLRGQDTAPEDDMYLKAAEEKR